MDEPVKFYKPVKFLLFDLDGTILDTEAMFIEAYTILLDRYGKTISNPIKSQMIGKGEEQLHKFLIQQFNLQNKTVEELIEEADTIQRRLYEEGRIELMPGVKELVEHMSTYDVPMAIATASPKRHVDAIIECCVEFFHLFDHIVTGEEGVRNKPYPDIYLESASRLQSDPNPRDFLVFEDSTVGVQAALAAGMQVVMIPDQTKTEHDILTVQRATKVIKSFHDFIPEEFGLPPYDTGEEVEYRRVDGFEQFR